MKRPLRAKKWKHHYTRLSEPDDLVFLCLPYWFVNTLLDSTERMLWSNVWEDENGNFPELTQEQREKIAYAIWQLSIEECDMNITVNPVLTQNNDCGGDCGGSGGSGCTTPPPWNGTPMPGGTPCYPTPIVNPPVNPVPPVPPPGTPESEWDLYRCKLANYAYDQIREWLVAVSGVPNTLITIGAILTLLWTLAPAGLLAIIGVAVLELAQVVAVWYALSEGIDEVAEFAVEWWDERHQEIVCMFYDMSDPALARTALVADFLDDLAIFAETRPWWVDSMMGMLAQFANRLFPLQIFLAPWELVPPAGYTGAIDCTLCAGGGVDPGLPDTPGYIWIPAPLTAVTFEPNNGTAVGHTDGEGIFTHAPASPLNYHEVNVSVDVSAVIAYHSVTNLHALAIRVQQYGSDTQVGNDGARLSSSTGGALDLLALTHLNEFWLHYQGDDLGATTLAAAWDVDHKSTYGNGVMSDGKASFRTQTYGSVSPASMVLDVWYLASE